MSKKSYQFLWSTWFVFLTLLSFCLILYTVKLMEDRKERISAESESKSFIQSIEGLLELESEKVARAKWSFMTNLTEMSRSNYQYTLFNYDKLVREIKLNMTSVPWETFKTSKLKRKFFLFLHSPRVSLLPPWKTAEFNAIKFNITTTQLKSIHYLQELPKKTTDGNGSTGVDSTTNWFEKQERDKINWIQFNDLIGDLVKSLYGNYTKLMNENAKLNEFPNALDYWITAEYEMEAKTMRRKMFDLWEEIKPLYQQLHAFVLDELKLRYGLNYSKDGLIPVHLFEMEGKAEGDWNIFYNMLKPFPKKKDLNITAELRKRRYSPQAMAQMSEDFFESNHFPTMLPDFWSESIFRVSPRTQMDCRPTLYKISNNEKQLRISLCGEKDENTFRIINKLMTQAKFILLRKDQPFLFRYETNSVMAVAAEEAVQMFMTSTYRLRHLGLMEDFEEDSPSKLNRLFQEALEFLPRMAHSIGFDQWNANVYGGILKSKDYNCNYWRIRQHLEGVKAPVTRKNSQFDPARSSYLVATPSSPLQNLVVSIMKYQLYKSLSMAAEEDQKIKYGEIDAESLENVSFGNRDSTLSLTGKAGELLNTVVLTGSARSWQSSLQQITNERELNVKPLLEYFDPLFLFLKDRNQKRGVKVQWDTSKVNCLKLLK